MPRTPSTPSIAPREAWHDIYLVGTEWNIYDKAYEVEWDFSHLEEDLEAEGRLWEEGGDHPVYLFGVTEPQSAALDPNDPEKLHVVLVPAIIAVHSKLPPPTQVALNALQREEEILEMRDLKMDWVPHLPRTAASATPGRVQPRAYFLKCFQRRSALRNLSEDAIIRFQYALPYILIPRLNGKIEYDTFVSPIPEVRGRATAPLEFDWTCDDAEEVAAEYCEDQEHLTKEDVPAVAQTIRDAVAEKKAGLRAKKKALDDAIAALSPEELESRDALYCVKYYPLNTAEEHRSNYINRYYGRAKEIR